MLKIRLSSERGHSDIGWLNTYHTFSFSDYYDPDYMGFGVLRVLNDDTVQPAGGFPEHHHENMEIISYVVTGVVEHQDNMGNGVEIEAGDVQYMSAGTGVRHSEFNPSETQFVRFLQIWLLPNKTGDKPRYQQVHIDRDAKINRWICLASSNGKENSINIHSDAAIYAAIVQPAHKLETNISSKKAWLQVVSGHIVANGSDLRAGDGAALEDVKELSILAKSEAEILLIEC